MTKEQKGKRLKEIRLKNRLSQESLAQILNVDRSQISRWENGKSDIPYDISTVVKDKFGFDLEEELLDDKDNNSVIDTIKSTHKENDIQIVTFAVIQFLGYIIGPWGFIVCLFGLYYAFKKSLPIWVKILSLLLAIHLFSDFLFFYCPEIFPTEVKVEDLNYVLQQWILS